MRLRLMQRAVLVLSAALLFCPNIFAHTPVQYQYAGDSGMWQHIYERSDAYRMPYAKPSSLMVPHHDITASQQNSLYKAVAQEIQPSVIVVIGPDHYEKGKACITIPSDDIVYCTPQGTIPLATDILHALTESTVADDISVQSDLWPAEHAIYAHTPFLGKYFPDAKLVPVVLKPLANDREFEIIKQFANVLSDILPDDALIVASVDCSHYQIPRVTALHDSVTRNTIANKEDPRYIEVDSPETLTFLTEYNRLRNITFPVLIDMTSTYDFIPNPNVESTSHLYWAFYKANCLDAVRMFNVQSISFDQRTNQTKYQARNQTILFTGSGSTNAGIRTCWMWDRYKTATDKAEIILRDLAGKEARFLSGFDLLIFDPEPGTTFTQKKHGTTVTVQSIRASELETLVPEKKAEPAISILVVTAQKDDETTLRDLFDFQKEYDILILRYDSPSCDTELYISARHTVYNLGVLYDELGKPIEGAVLAIDWNNSHINTELFEYTSESGKPPAIHQFPAEE